jgi:hypothetical protein
MDLHEFHAHWERVTDGHYLTDTVHEGHRPFASLVEAWGLLSKYVKGGYHAEHDILYIGDPFYDEAPNISEEDMIRLAQLGIHWDDQYDGCFAAFC